jgi:hypothetical protein
MISVSSELLKVMGEQGGDFEALLTYAKYL